MVNILATVIDRSAGNPSKDARIPQSDSARVAEILDTHALDP